MPQNLKISTANKQQLKIMLDWAADEGWNPGLYDLDSFYAADPNGFFIAEKNNQIVGCCSNVIYNDNLAFLGFYIVKPEFRNTGIGMQITHHVIKYSGTRTIGLDGVVQMQEKYKKIGFKTAHNNMRYQGISSKQKVSSDVVNLSSVDFTKIVKYDQKHFGTTRSNFLKKWINQPKTTAIGSLKDGELSGYGVIRPCREGYKIGPLFAEDFSTAEKIFLKLISSIQKDQQFYLDIPTCNKDALKLVNNYNMQAVFETGRMYKNKPLEIPLNNIFGITSFELG